MVRASREPLIGTHASRGFTLVEIIVVIVIMGIAALLVVPHVLEAGTVSIQAAARLIVSDLLYAQNEAVAAQATYKVAFDPTNNRYQLTDEDDAVLTNEQIGGPYVVDFATNDRMKNITLSLADFAGGGVVTFDEMGAPSSGGTVELVSGARHYRITVAPFTGRITVESLTD